MYKLSHSEYGKDIRQIVKVLLDHGWVVTPGEAERLWSRYSESMCAGWMCIEHEDDIWILLEGYLEEDCS